MSEERDIAWTMTAILGTGAALVAALVYLQTPYNSNIDNHKSSWLPCPKKEPSKRAYELFVAAYTPVWILAFAVIVAFQLYEQFTAWNYLQVCGGLAAPFVLQPFLFPSVGVGFLDSPDAYRPLLERYSFKANLWIAVYSFIGNYWYTHYFYSVLGASYSMPSHRLNQVPIAMFLATHFYFSTYHMFSNLLLRKVVTTYRPSFLRSVLFVSVVVVFSYFTAFMETLTISSYPYYSFRDRNMAYTVGSAFYGIYFLVSFPAFFHFDSEIDTAAATTTTSTTTSGRGSNKQQQKQRQQQHAASTTTAWGAIVSSCGYGMMILTLLDFVRLYLDIPLVVGGSGGGGGGSP